MIMISSCNNTMPISGSSCFRLWQRYVFRASPLGVYTVVVAFGHEEPPRTPKKLQETSSERSS